MNDAFGFVLLLICRYLHIVSATLLVGGTLFYEMVVPIAIDDLRAEQQLLVFARARWVFKYIVWFSVIIMLLSGAVLSATHWRQYTDPQVVQYRNALTGETIREPVTDVPQSGRPGLWWAAHVSTGVIALLIALSLTIGPNPPVRPIRWMRLNLIILLLVMFAAAATWQARIIAEQSPGNDSNHAGMHGD